MFRYGYKPTEWGDNWGGAPELAPTTDQNPISTGQAPNPQGLGIMLQLSMHFLCPNQRQSSLESCPKLLESPLLSEQGFAKCCLSR